MRPSIFVASEDATAGSVMARHERIVPSSSGSSHCRFCAGGRHNLRRRIRLRCQSYFAACSAVSETHLILTMPQRHARILNAQFGNQSLPVPLKVPPFDTHLYWHANADGDPANAWLLQQLINALRTPRVGLSNGSQGVSAAPI